MPMSPYNRERQVVLDGAGDILRYAEAGRTDLVLLVIPTVRKAAKQMAKLKESK